MSRNDLSNIIQTPKEIHDSFNNKYLITNVFLRTNEDYTRIIRVKN